MGSKTLRIIEKELSLTGLPYRIEEGKKHHNVFLNGVRVGVISKTTGGEDAPGVRNLQATIRRSARGQIACQSTIRSSARA